MARKGGSLGLLNLKTRVKHQWKCLERNSNLKTSFLLSTSKSSSFKTRSLQASQMHRRNPEPTPDLSAPDQDIKKAIQDNVEVSERPLYQLVFLGDDVEQSVEILEVEEIDFTDVELRLENGQSVFIAKRECEKVEIGDVDKDKAKDLKELW